MILFWKLYFFHFLSDTDDCTRAVRSAEIEKLQNQLNNAPASFHGNIMQLRDQKFLSDSRIFRIEFFDKREILINNLLLSSLSIRTTRPKSGQNQRNFENTFGYKDKPANFSHEQNGKTKHVIDKHDSISPPNFSINEKLR